MDVDLIARAVRDIRELEPALSWLKEYGAALVSEDKSSFAVSITPTYASACPGAKEAAVQLTAVACLHIAEIVRHAIEDAENTIELRREQIRQECTT